MAKVLSELTAPDSPSVLIIDDLHELSSTEQLTTLLTNLPTRVRAVLSTGHIRLGHI